MIRFGPEILQDLDAALSKEWLETNGLGSYASSTLCGANTRCYHGLFVPALNPPVQRVVLLSKLEETLCIDGERFELSTNLYQGATHPAGYQYLEEFRLDPSPVMRWRIQGIAIEKSVCLLQEEQILSVEYRCEAPAELEVQPLIAFRDYHGSTQANGFLNPSVLVESDMVSIQPYPDLPRLFFAHNAREVRPTGTWFYRFRYPREEERGLRSEEDLFQPFVMRFETAEPARIRVSITASHGRSRSKTTKTTNSSNELVPALKHAARQFIVSRGMRKSVIAGYHWFTDWGRDTMISLPGVMAAGYVSEARDILLTYIGAMRQGLLPNRFSDGGGEVEYNAADAALWMVIAAAEYVNRSGDHTFVRDHALPAVEELIDWRKRGTWFNIRLDEDGLLMGGADGVQLTWMDAKVGDYVVTPRRGKPVEIQALWYNLLRIGTDWARAWCKPRLAVQWRKMAVRAQASFQERFWNAESGCLFDVVDAEDASIRPNQMFALSLPFSLLDAAKGRAVLEVVRRELLTPYGLRTLSPKDPAYQPRYEGGPVSRDGAYHQGTVWPWLLGPYIRAVFAVEGRNEATMREARSLLESFRKHLLEAGIGQISEIFDGDSPHTARGCIAQAWSVAELLRIALEVG